MSGNFLPKGSASPILLPATYIFLMGWFCSLYAASLTDLSHLWHLQHHGISITSTASHISLLGPPRGPTHRDLSTTCCLPLTTFINQGGQITHTSYISLNQHHIENMAKFGCHFRIHPPTTLIHISSNAFVHLLFRSTNFTLGTHQGWKLLLGPWTKTTFLFIPKQRTLLFKF